MEKFSNTEINNAGENYRGFVEGQIDKEIIQNYRNFRCLSLKKINVEIAENLSKSDCIVSCRVKRFETIIRKMRRMSKTNLTQIDDIIGFRIIANTPSEQKKIVDILTNKIKIKKVKNYIEAPRESGYQAIHLIADDVIDFENKKYFYSYEIQLRTHFQNIWGTISESFGEQAKEGNGSKEVKAYLQELSTRISEYEKNNINLKQIN